MESPSLGLNMEVAAIVAMHIFVLFFFWPVVRDIRTVNCGCQTLYNNYEEASD